MCWMKGYLDGQLASLGIRGLLRTTYLLLLYAAQEQYLHQRDKGVDSIDADEYEHFEWLVWKGLFACILADFT